MTGGRDNDIGAFDNFPRRSTGNDFEGSIFFSKAYKLLQYGFVSIKYFYLFDPGQHFFEAHQMIPPLNPRTHNSEHAGIFDGKISRGNSGSGCCAQGSDITAVHHRNRLSGIWIIEGNQPHDRW